MIKFLLKSDRHDQIVGLGLSQANIDLLKKGQPIIVDMGALLGFGYSDLKVCIFFGETEEAMAEDMAKYIDKNTIVIDRKKGVEN